MKMLGKNVYLLRAGGNGFVYDLTLSKNPSPQLMKKK